MSKLVLLATYNGAAFLPEQIDSIVARKTDWKLLVRDDCSVDETKDILCQRSLVDERLILLDHDNQQLGARGNFAHLLDTAKEMGAEYCALSDQDDVWMPSKLDDQFVQMEAVEKNYPGSPLLIHSDLEVVNQNLETIHPSFMQFQGVYYEAVNPLQVLLCQNFVTGCTVMMNKELMVLSLPVPEQALMHDWWLALCAATFGRLEYCDKPLVKYRQHGHNEVGARNFWQFINPFKNNWYQHWKKGRDNLLSSMLQARALAERVRELEPENQHLQLIEEYASLIHLSPLQRIRKLYAIGVHMQSPFRQLLMISRLLFFRRLIPINKLF